jgi:hypothetical protein
MSEFFKPPSNLCCLKQLLLHFSCRTGGGGQKTLKCYSKAEVTKCFIHVPDRNSVKCLDSGIQGTDAGNSVCGGWATQAKPCLA